jgi:hypothetical protein
MRRIGNTVRQADGAAAQNKDELLDMIQHGADKIINASNK